MEEILIDNVKVGDYILCSCALGCYSSQNCAQSCDPNASPCQLAAKWKKVIDIIKTPAAHSTHFEIDMEDEKVHYGWSKTTVFKRID
jgi:hypothetical protein